MKRIKMVLYAEPGVGKSVFASKAPKPFFICTDGNYEWLEDFGADPNAHANVQSWSEIKSLISKPEKFNDYETVVLDLTEDAFKWCESEYCIRNKIEHVSDVGYGKAYDATRNEFFINICKLIALDKNIILIMHGLSVVEKDRRGIEHTKYVPSSRIPDKVLDMIEGRVRYFLRAYLKDEEHDDGTVTKRRWLSLVPKPNEFGIIRGVDENVIPQDIPLEWSEFAKAIGYESGKTMSSSNVTVSSTIEAPTTEATKTRKSRKTEETPKEVIEEPAKEIEGVKIELGETPEEKAASTVASEPAPVKTEESKKTSNEDKLAAIRAKLAAMNKR